MGTPRWVKVAGLVGLAVLVLFVVVLLVGGGEHGPGRHQSRDRTRPPPRALTETELDPDVTEAELAAGKRSSS